MKIRILIIALMCLLVAGCGKVSFDAEHLKQADKLCKENGGVESVNRVSDWVHPNYICNDGVIFEIYGTRIEKHEPIVGN